MLGVTLARRQRGSHLTRFSFRCSINPSLRDSCRLARVWDELTVASFLLPRANQVERNLSNDNPGMTTTSPLKDRG
jgi:hypothetical protein